MYEQPLEAGLTAYAQSIGKAPDDLTDDEIRFALDKICDVINEELIRATMIGQQVPEILGVTKKTAAYEDYSPAVHNPDRIHFGKPWTHSDTKLGAPLSPEALLTLTLSFTLSSPPVTFMKQSLSPSSDATVL